MKTLSTKPDSVRRDWCLMNADGKVLGRLASEIAKRLRGKHKPEYSPCADAGDYIVVINAAKLVVSGNKADGKVYYHHTGYPGGIKSHTFNQLMDKSPMRVLETAVKGMLPKGPLGRQMFRKLKVYNDENHPHAAQQPQVIEI